MLSLDIQKDSFDEPLGFLHWHRKKPSSPAEPTVLALDLELSWDCF
jgi:hypothetical protein